MAENETRLDRLVALLPHGYAARAAAPERDALPLSQLINEMRAGVGDPLLDSAADVHDNIAGGEVNTALDTMVIEGPDGVLAGYAVAYPVLDGAKPRVFLFGATRPSVHGQGIGSALIAWTMDRAHERLQQFPDGTIQAQCGEGESRTQRLYQSVGMRPIRWFHDLELRFDVRTTTRDPERFALPAGYSAQPFSSADPEEIRLLHNACFADHWGSSAMSLNVWHEEIMDHEGARPAYGEIVRDESGRAVAYQLTAEFPQDLETTGRVLWISKLGVLPEHRGRGIATALIERHLARAQRDGFEGVMLGVDTESLTGANKLYERVGFTPRYGGVRYILGDANFS
jgi:GNAT superfamily N-acetyltransferase